MSWGPVFDQIVVPIALGAAAGAAVGAGSAPFVAHPLSVGLFTAAGVMVAVNFQRTPKKYHAFRPSRMEKRAPADTFNATLQAPAQDVRIIMSAENRQAANIYHLTRYEWAVSSRIAYHHLYLEGKITSRYLVTNGICKRNDKTDEVQKFRNLFLERHWVVPVGRTLSNGVELTCVGKIIFRHLADTYSPTPDEIKAKEALKNGGTSHTHTPHAHPDAYPIAAKVVAL